MLSSSKEKFTQHELRKDTKNFHMMTWQKSVNSETFHIRAGMYLDAREDTLLHLKNNNVVIESTPVLY